MKLLLNGDNWTLTGWLRHQWHYDTIVETGGQSIPPIAPLRGRVPGAVQDDLLKAGLIKDYNAQTYCCDMEWAENRDWVYETDFTVDKAHQNERYQLCFDGLDYNGHIFLNDQLLASFEGTYVRHYYDVTGLIKENESNHLKVVLLAAPEIDAQIGYTSRTTILKPRFNYFWDWCPRIVNIGIHRDVFLKSWAKLRINDFYPKARVEGENGTVDLRFDAEVTESGNYLLEYEVLYQDRAVTKGTVKRWLATSQHAEICETVTVEKPHLWWTNTQGDSPVYRVRVRILSEDGQVCCDEASKQIGFRTLEFVQNEGSWEESLPYTVKINSEKIFLRGVNWVPISPLPGIVRRKDYVKYLSIFKEMNINILRVWGGALLETEEFYELCDQYGILVWQEFPQTSSGLDDTPCEEKEFVDALEQIAREYVLQRRHHPSLLLWCGGNELQWHNHVPVDLRSRNIYMLSQVVKELDPERLFLPTSSFGKTFMFNREKVGQQFNQDVHGAWEYLGDVEHYKEYNMDDSLFRSEVGCPAPARLEALEKYCTEGKLWPPDRTNRYWVHRGLWWLRLEQMQGLFKTFAEDGSELAEFVRAFRYIQFESIRYTGESSHRRFPQQAGMIVWMGNEPFPNSINTSLIEFDGTTKPAYYALQKAYSGFHVSAKYEKIAHKTNEPFTAQIHITADRPSGTATVTSQILTLRGQVLDEKQATVPVEKFTEHCFDHEWKVEKQEGGIFLLKLTAVWGDETSENIYVYSVDSDKPFAPLLELPAAELSVTKEGANCVVANRSDYAAVGLFIYGVTATGETVNYAPNALTVLPGETYTLEPMSQDEVVELKVDCFNA